MRIASRRVVATFLLAALGCGSGAGTPRSSDADDASVDARGRVDAARAKDGAISPLRDAATSPDATLPDGAIPPADAAPDGATSGDDASLPQADSGPDAPVSSPPDGSGNVPPDALVVPDAMATPPPPAGYSLTNVVYGGPWFDPRIAGSYTQGLGEISTSAAGLRLFTEVSGKAFVDGELPEWVNLLYSTDQVATGIAPFKGPVGALSFVVPSGPAAAPDFSQYAQSACTNSTVLLNGYYYTYFEAFMTLPPTTLSGGGASPPLYVLSVFVGRSTTLEGEREVYVGKDSGGTPQWAATPNTATWAPVLRPYVTLNYQVDGDTLGPAGRPSVTWSGTSNAIYAAGAPSAVVVDDVVHLFYLDVSYSLSPGSFLSQPWTNQSGACVRALTPNTFFNGVQDGSATCATPEPAAQAPYTFELTSTDGVTFPDTAPTILPDVYSSYDTRYVDETQEYVRFAEEPASATQPLGVYLTRSSDGIHWSAGNPTSAAPSAANAPILDLTSAASYFGASGAVPIVSGDAANHLSLSSPLYLGLASAEPIASGNFSMNFETARLFVYSADLQTQATATGATAALPAGPTDHAQDFNPAIPLALETFYGPAATANTYTFTVCGSDFAPLANTYAEAFWTNAFGQMAYGTSAQGDPTLNPPVYDDLQAAPYGMRGAAESYFHVPGRTCFSIDLVSPPTTESLTVGFYDNSSSKFFAVPVDFKATTFDGSTPADAPLGISMMERSASALTFCGTGLYASRANLYALLRYTPPSGGPAQSDIFYFTSAEHPGVDPTYELTMYTDATTRLRCGTIPLGASAQALIDSQGWQLALGVADPDSGQEIRVPVR